MGRISIWQVDAFTDRVFGGNPAGVVPDARGLSPRAMQAIAREMNLSETAFVTRPSVAGADFRVRFFTPGHEVDLCGHATIATFHVLAWTGAIRGAGAARRRVVQQTGAGLLPVEVEFDAGRASGVAMEQARPRSASAAGVRDVAAALGVGLRRIDASLPVECSSTGLWAVMVPLRSAEDLARLRPRPDLFDALAPGVVLSGVYAFALERRGARARFFVCPRYGIFEDPFTGTAAGALGAHLVRHGRLAEGDSIRVRQGIEMGRPGHGEVRALRGGCIEVSGTAVPVFRTGMDAPGTRSWRVSRSRPT